MHETERRVFFPLFLTLCYSYDLSRLVTSVLSAHRPPRCIQSALLSLSCTHTHTHRLTHTHTGHHCFPPWQKRSMLFFQCDFFFSLPAIFVPQALSVLPPLLSVSLWLTTPTHPTVSPKTPSPYAVLWLE